jgi:6-phosphogluconolactonase
MEAHMKEASTAGAVYVQSNEANNEVIAFGRGDGGALSRTGSFGTGGKGTGVPHLTSQGSVVLTGDGRFLLVTNAASDDASLFSVADGRPELLRTAATGPAPKSLTEHDGLVYVLNTGEPGLSAFRIRENELRPVAGSKRSLPSGADPAQAGFSPDGRTLLVTERGTDSIVAFPVGVDGLLGEPVRIPSSGPTPYGFAVSNAGTLVVTEAFRAQKGAAAASSYLVRDGSVAPVTRSVGNGRSEICWAVITKDGRYAFTTNFADGAVSRYAIGRDGSLTIEDPVAGTAVEGETGLRDEDLAGDGLYLYAIDADAGRLFGWAVGDGGALGRIGSWEGLPNTVAGLAAS